ncbi:MAG: hypothetical protein ABEN55_09470 [Bradymonadaceae bacterium]
MPDLPTFQDLYDEFEAETRGSNKSRLNDFSAGSFLDAFAGVAASAVRGIDRWVLRQIQNTYLESAPDGELETVAVDLYGDDLSRRQDENFESYRRRVLGYRENGLKRGTAPALGYFGESIEGVVVASVEERDPPGVGAVAVTLRFDDDETSESDVREAWKEGIDAWRAVGAPVSLAGVQPASEVDQTQPGDSFEPVQVT